MAKGSGTTRSSASGSPKGLNANIEPIKDGYYTLDGKTVRIVSNNTIKQYSSMSKAELRDEARRIFRVNSYDNSTSKADYLGDVLGAKFGRNFIVENDLTADEKRRLIKKTNTY